MSGKTQLFLASSQDKITVAVLVLLCALIHGGNPSLAFKDPFVHDDKGARFSQAGDEEGVNYVKGTKSTYLVVSTVYLNYSDASAYCAYFGGALVSIETREKDQEVAALVPDSLIEYWTSGVYSSSSGKFQWATGQVAWEYLNFEFGHGMPPFPGDAITMLGMKEKGNIWHSHPIHMLGYGFICEFTSEGPSTPVPATTTTTTAAPFTSTSTTTLSTTTDGSSGCGNFQCPSPNGHFSDPANCAAFYSCAGGLCVGHLVCPEGLLFNPGRQICDYPNEVDCTIQ